jgi:hypothetical protein
VNGPFRAEEHDGGYLTQAFRPGLVGPAFQAGGGSRLPRLDIERYAELNQRGDAALLRPFFLPSDPVLRDHGPCARGAIIGS